MKTVCLVLILLLGICTLTNGQNKVKGARIAYNSCTYEGKTYKDRQFVKALAKNDCEDCSCFQDEYIQCYPNGVTGC
ncbi:uncharacterized protein LOC131929931 [Physella acuta]|uniref:uncharacterized protein LOC131929931 n=1 Tax=Physella acuta TaxID=109671 RepID=UPI0027DE995C|nr:uncharacterized protein LOC131929931 [Physella acuta]